MCGLLMIRGNSIPVKDFLMNHRGIERRGFQDENVEMIHNRLPLQTRLGDEWGGPIEIQGGHFLFVGEIFNHPQEWENDVEYLQYFFNDPDWMDKLAHTDWDGFWAIVVYQHGVTYTFTDPLGKKQLYYDHHGNLCSEIKPLLNGQVLISQFDYENTQAGRLTPFDRIYRIKPGQLMVMTPDKDFKSIGNLWNLYQFPESGVTQHRTLRGLIKISVRRRMINLRDRNTVFVSGGLDSTIIIQCLAEMDHLDKCDFLTIKNGEDDQYIEAVESHYGIRVRRIDYNPFIKPEDIMEIYEHPIELGSLMAQVNLVRETQGSVIYTGDGADELFSGYSRAQEWDSQEYDVFTEIPYYHMIRLDRIGMSVTKEIRSPFLGHEVVCRALNMGYDVRRGKACLKDSFADIPEVIINRAKRPLRDPNMDSDRAQHIKHWEQTFRRVFSNAKN
jgi:asparagine synthetase B (glutamine-hydrolysing)